MPAQGMSVDELSDRQVRQRVQEHSEREQALISKLQPGMAEGLEIFTIRSKNEVHEAVNTLREEHAPRIKKVEEIAQDLNQRVAVLERSGTSPATSSGSGSSSSVSNASAGKWVASH
eukprot:387838-Pyramimonas_sp.AAC.1